MRGVLLIMLAAGCGRVSFDPLGLDGQVDGVVGSQFPVLGATWLVPANPGTDAPCSFDTVFHDSCSHPAELLTVRFPDDTTDCATLTVADDLGAFDWRCRRDGGALVLESLGLKREAGLATLLEPGGWKLNRVVARAGTVEWLATEPGVWWTNPVVPLPDNATSGAGVMLDASHTIYTLATSRDTAGYSIAADYIGIVMLGGAVLSRPVTLAANCGENGAMDSRCLITALQPHTGTWIEGELGGLGALVSPTGFGIQLTGSRWATLRHLDLHGFLMGAVLEDATGALVYDIVATLNGWGIRSHDSNVTARHLVFAANGTGYHADGAGYHVVADIRAFNNGDGIHFINSAAGFFADVVSANNEGHGLWTSEALNGGSAHAVISISNQGPGLGVGLLTGGSYNRILAVNNGGDGVRFGNTSSTELAQIAVAHNAAYGVELTGCTDNLVVDNLLVGPNSSGPCSVTSSTNAGLDNACARPAPMLGNTVLGVSLLSSFVGGSAMASYDTLDWTQRGPYQIWGRDSTTALDPAARGRCTPGTTCRLWDFSLAVNDAVLRDAAETGMPQPDPFVAGATCPAAANGSLELSAAGEHCFPGYPATCPRKYLINGLEILDDHAGNDDGYCESNERCIYLPHLSSYPGSGALIGPCVFEDGLADEITGVTLYGYAN